MRVAALHPPPPSPLTKRDVSCRDRDELQRDNAGPSARSLRPTLTSALYSVSVTVLLLSQLASFTAAASSLSGSNNAYASSSADSSSMLALMGTAPRDAATSDAGEEVAYTFFDYASLAVKFLWNVFYVCGAFVQYYPQWRAIRRGVGTAFSPLVCLILLTANITRIFYYVGEPFDLVLLYQSIVMVLVQLVVLQAVCEDKLRRITARVHGGTAPAPGESEDNENELGITTGNETEAEQSEAEYNSNNNNSSSSIVHSTDATATHAADGADPTADAATGAATGGVSGTRGHTTPGASASAAAKVAVAIAADDHESSSDDGGGGIAAGGASYRAPRQPRVIGSAAAAAAALAVSAPRLKRNANNASGHGDYSHDDNGHTVSVAPAATASAAAAAGAGGRSKGGYAEYVDEDNSHDDRSQGGAKPSAVRSDGTLSNNSSNRSLASAGSSSRVTSSRGSQQPQPPQHVMLHTRYPSSAPSFTQSLIACCFRTRAHLRRGFNPTAGDSASDGVIYVDAPGAHNNDHAHTNNNNANSGIDGNDDDNDNNTEQRTRTRMLAVSAVDDGVTDPHNRGRYYVRPPLTIFTGGWRGITVNFWAWELYSSYLLFLVCFTLVLTVFSVALMRYVAYVVVLGYIALMIEAMLGVPQAYKNCIIGTRGLSAFLIWSWLLGDIVKTAFFIMLDAPMPFLVCGSFQVAVDIFIMLQIARVCLFFMHPALTICITEQPFDASCFNYV